MLSELDYWCAERLSVDAWLVFLDDLRAGVYRTEAPTVADVDRCRQLQDQYRDLRLGVVDASLVALAERLDEVKIATLDERHLRVVRPRHVPAFDLLPH